MWTDRDEKVWEDELFRRSELHEIGCLVLGFLCGLSFGCLVAFAVLVLR